MKVILSAFRDELNIYNRWVSMSWHYVKGILFATTGGCTLDQHVDLKALQSQMQLY